MDMTIREIDAYAKGVDMTRRSDMASMLWAAWSNAGFNAYVWGGKRLPNIEQRLHAIMHPAKGRQTEVTQVIWRMNEIARRKGLPPPKARMH